MTARKKPTQVRRTIPQQPARSRPTAIPDVDSQEFADLVREFEDEFIADSFGEPTAAQKAQWQRAKRKRGRPKTGKGVKVISLSLERTLLAEADHVAKKLGVPRSQLISRGLRLVLDSGEVANGKRPGSARRRPPQR